MDGITNKQQDDSIEEESTPKAAPSNYERLLKENEELKKRNNEISNWAQKANWINKVGTDRNQFIKLYESDKKLAGEVAEYFNDKYWNTWNAEDYYNSIKWWSSDYDKTFDEEKIVNRVKQDIQKEESKKVLDSLLEDKWIKRNSEFGKDVMNEFNDLIEGKQVTSDNVKKYFGKALREAKQTSDFAENYLKTVSDVNGIWDWRKAISQPSKGSWKRQKVSIYDFWKK